MNNNDPRRLIDESLERPLSGEEFASLQSELKRSAPLREFYLGLVRLSTDLEGEFGDGSAAAPTAAPNDVAPRPKPRFAAASMLSGVVVGALAASLAFVWFSAPFAGGADSGAGEVAEAAGPADTRPVIATLTGMVDCVWAADVKPPAYAQPLFAGQRIHLQSGLAQITFESGARCILEGEADFTIASEMKATLTKGKISTLVSTPQARGFTITSPTAEVLDLGTEFAMEVEEEGDTRLHVFDGEVLSWAIDADGNLEGDTISLLESEGATFRHGVLPIREPADAAHFVREIAPRLDESELSPLPVRRSLQMWLSADKLVTRTEDGSVVAWRDILVGDNDVSDDAWPPAFEGAHPVWIPDAIGGKPALRFDGQTDYLITAPFLSTPDQSVFVVMSSDLPPTNELEKRQVLNYNGPPFRLAANPASPYRILQIDDKGRAGAFRAFVYAKVGKRSNIDSASVRMQSAAIAGQPLALAYVHDATQRTAQLWVNGQKEGQAEALPGEDFISRKIIGRHPLEYSHFKGDIAEIIIFNTALDVSEVVEVSGYLRKKYAIQ